MESNRSELRKVIMTALYQINVYKSKFLLYILILLGIIINVHL